MMELKEATYTCSECKHTQTITYFADDQILPVTCCVVCRAGFEMPLGRQMQEHRGMFPGKATAVRH